MKYWRQFFTLFSLCFVLIGVISVEQVYGLPLLYVGLSVLWLEKRNNLTQLLGAVVLGSVLATIYTFNYSLGYLLLLLSVWLFQSVRARLASQTGALLVTATSGGIICGFLSPLQLSLATLLSVVISFMVLILVSKITLTQSSKRYHL